MKPQVNKIKFSKLITIKILVIFTLFSAGWIFLTNNIISKILNLSSELTKVFIYNGWLYAIVTGLIFYFLIAKYNMHIYEESSIVTNRKVQKHMKKWPWYLIIIVLLSSLGVFQVDSLFYKIQKAEYKEESENELKSISELKVNFINNWKNERSKCAGIFLNNPIVNGKIVKYIQNNKSNSAELESLFSSFLSDSNFTNICLLDLQGNALLNVFSSSENINNINKLKTGDYYKENKQILSDFRINESDPEKLSIDIFIPVFNHDNYNSCPVGAVMFKVDPYRVLFPYIQSWATSSKSAETILIRYEKDSVLYLNPPKNLNNTESYFKKHILNSELSNLDLYNCNNNIVETKDYRDKKVLASVYKVPDTEWYLISKIDQEEIYSDLLKSAKLFTILLAIVIIGGGLTIILYWRKHIARHYKKQYETELEKLALARNFEFMTKYANDIILLADENWNLVEANERAISVYGYSRDELLNMTVLELRTEEQQKLYTEQIADIDINDGVLLETVHRRKDGTVFNVESSIRKISIDGNTFYQAILRDITERKIAEDELRKSKEKAEEMNRLKSTFLMNMGHELRTPLNGIIGYADFLNDELEDEKQKEMVGIIIDGGKRLTRTLNSIIDLSIIESNEVEVNLRPLKLSEVVKDSVTQLKSMAEEKNLKITSNFGENIYSSLDSGLINRIIYNLIHNAITYTKEGDIKVEVGKECLNNREYAYLRVTDSGIGIPENKMKIIFEPFRQVSEGINRRYEGAGLGLTITKKFTELMNGKILVKSMTDIGSEFTVMFPLVKIHHQNNNSIAPELKKVADQAQKIINQTAKKILILNGNKDIIDTKTNILKCICKTDTVDSEELALEIIRKNCYDVILMELGVNNVNRLQIAQRIREIKGYEKTPILAVTDSESTKSREICLQEGCSHYLTKPFQLTDLIQLVNQLLGNK